MSNSLSPLWRTIRVCLAVLELLVVVGLFVRAFAFFRPSFAFTVGSSAYVFLVSVVLFGVPALGILQACFLCSPMRRAARFGLARVAGYFLVIIGILSFTPLH